MRHRFRGVLVAVIVLVAPPVVAEEAPGSPAIEDGTRVDIEYTLTDDGGRVIDSNAGEAPLTYVQGRKQLPLAALERELRGMHAGEAKRVRLTPEQGYGVPDPKAVMEVAKEMVPEGALEVGTQLNRRGFKGEPLPPVTIKEVKERTVVLDLNHPLAGKTLVFDVKILRVVPPGGAAGAEPASKLAR